MGSILVNLISRARYGAWPREGSIRLGSKPSEAFRRYLNAAKNINTTIELTEAAFLREDYEEATMLYRGAYRAVESLRKSMEKGVLREKPISLPKHYDQLIQSQEQIFEIFKEDFQRKIRELEGK